MKRTKTMLLLGLTVAMLTAGAMGREHDEGRRGARLREAFGKLDLTEDQKADLRLIFQGVDDADKAKRRETAEAMRKAREEWKAARASRDREAIDAAARKLHDLHQQFRDSGKGVREQVEAVLTASQREKLKELMSEGRWRPLDKVVADLKRLDLSAEQSEKVNRIVEHARAEASGKDSYDAKASVYRAACESIKGLLTDEQAATWANRRGEGRRAGQAGKALAELGLSEQQSASIDAIRAETREAVKAASTPEAKRKAISEARRRIGELLTDEQTQQLRERYGRRRRGDATPAE